MGYVYVLTNRAMPGLVKIGRTWDLEQRVAGLSAATGVPVPFDVASVAQVLDPVSVEYAAHSALAAFRLSDRREFFTCSTDHATQVIADIIELSRVGSAEAAEIIHANLDLDQVDALMARLASVTMKDFLGALSGRRAA